MASASELLQDWYSDEGPRRDLFGKSRGLVLRWLNQGQLRFADKSECLRDTWEPFLSDDGKAALPDDFLREVPNLVYWNDSMILSKGEYSALSALSLTTTDHYTIWGDYFYVFAPSAGSPKIHYIKKPIEITPSTYTSVDLEIPTEYHLDLVTYLDAQMSRRGGDMKSFLALMAQFDTRTREAGIVYSMRRDPVKQTLGMRL